ncbi:MFS transporter [Ferrimicrobium acidiphilum]|uniref:MFS transporter n=1 Tax=Ferrimicrobium acidiphilum TaxID=121039 RepID=UPI0023F4C3B5|nr:MFS transporter [Ferrimicrobium acidiphilum]
MNRKWWTLVVACTATFMFLVDLTIVIVALPQIEHALHANFADIEWVVDAYALTLAAALLTAGALADRYGQRLIFVIGLVIFTLGSALCGLAQSPLMLILSRAGQGIGGAIIFATSLSLLANSFHGKDRGVAFGIWGGITGLAAGVGPILGGVITTGISWRGIFWVNVPLGAAAIIVTLWNVEEYRSAQSHRPDWTGFVTFTAAMVALVYGLTEAGRTSWGNTSVIASLCAAVALIAVFIIAERSAVHPMLDLSLFRVPTFDGGLIAAFAMNASLFAMLLYLVLYLQDDLGYSALGTGMRLLLLTGPTLIVATIAGRASSHIPVRWLIGPGLGLVGVGLILMAGLDAASSWTHLLPGLLVAGVGSGLVNPPLASTAVGVVKPQRAGMASGANSTGRQIGIAVGIAVYGTLFTTLLLHSLEHALSRAPGLARRSAEIASAIDQGTIGRAIVATTPRVRGELVTAIHSAYTGALNELLIVSGILALAGAVLAVSLIRPKDFVGSSHN